MLYQTVRPQSLDEMFGNEATVASLKAIVAGDISDRPHTYLFYGDTGCGKTTLARILVHEFGCTDLDINEYNAASTRGIDTARDISSRMHLCAMGVAKAYIIDESHQLTSAAQEALLKAAEDIPSHCYLMFCTTKPESIIATLRNRCTSYGVEKLRPPIVKELLDAIVEATEMSVPAEVLSEIVYNCDGCPRTALITLEKVVGLPLESALECAKESGERNVELVELCRALVAKTKYRWPKVVRTLSGLKTNETEAIRRGVLGYLNSCLLRATDASEGDRFAGMIEVMDGSTLPSGKAVLTSMLFRVSCM